MTFDEWEEKFKPLPNHITEDRPGGEDWQWFETFDEDLRCIQEMRKRSPTRIWTIVEDSEDADILWIVPGYHHVNRMGYLITTNPWKPGQEDINYDS